MSNIIEKIAVHSGARGNLIDPLSGLLQCTTEVNGRSRDLGIFDPNNPLGLPDDTVLGRASSTFVPMERLMLDEDAYEWQSEVDPAALGWDIP